MAGLRADIEPIQPTDELDLALRLASIAPSPRNTQPWIFACASPRTVELWRDRARSRPICDPHHRELTISCGVALYYLRIALASMGVRHTVRLQPHPSEPDLVTVVHTGDASADHDEAAKSLVAAACSRVTNWGDFYDLPVNEADLAVLIGGVPDGIGVSATVVTETQRQSVDALIESANSEQFADPRFVEELTRWPIGRPLPLENEPVGEKAPTGTLIMLSTPTDNPEDWIATGQTLARLILTGTGLGLSTTFLNQAVQIKQDRLELAVTLDSPGVPQQLLRLGFAETSGKRTPRRDIKDVLRDVRSTLHRPH